METPFVEAVHVEVHPARSGLLAHDEAVAVDEREGRGAHALDVAGRRLGIDHALRAVGLAQHRLEAVLVAVEPEEVEASVGRPVEVGDVLVGVGTRVDARAAVGVDVVDPELHLGVGVARLRVFESIGLVVERAVEAHHFEQGHAALVEAQVGDAAAVGREGVGLRESELLLVHPVGGAVDDLVPLAVGGHAAQLLAARVIEVEVVLVRGGDPAAVGRERGVARRLELPHHGQHGPLGGQEVGGGVGVAVDGRGAYREEHRLLVGREEVVVDAEVARNHGQQRASGVVVAPHVGAFEYGVVFAVGHRADALHGFVHPAQTQDLVVALGVGGGRREAERRDSQQFFQGRYVFFAFHAVFSGRCRRRPERLPRAGAAACGGAGDQRDVSVSSSPKS